MFSSVTLKSITLTIIVIGMWDVAVFTRDEQNKPTY